MTLPPGITPLPPDALPPAEADAPRAPTPDLPPDDSADPSDDVAYRGATSDPVFGYVVAVATVVGLMPLLPNGAQTRYTLAWMLLAGFGVLAWLFGDSARIGPERPGNVMWGVTFGVLVSVPLLLFGGGVVETMVLVLFQGVAAGALLAYLVFVMPLAETLFFRGVLQQTQGAWLVALASSIWAMLLFFPVLNVARYPAVSVFIGVLLLVVNAVYSYVRQRNGLAAAWACQIVVNVVLLYLPFVRAGG